MRENRKKISLIRFIFSRFLFEMTMRMIARESSILSGFLIVFVTSEDFSFFLSLSSVAHKYRRTMDNLSFVLFVSKIYFELDVLSFYFRWFAFSVPAIFVVCERRTFVLCASARGIEHRGSRRIVWRLWFSSQAYAKACWWCLFM